MTNASRKIINQIHFLLFHFKTFLGISSYAISGLPRIKSVLNADFLQHRTREDKIDIIFWELRDIEQTLKELRYNQPYKHVIVDIHSHEIRSFLQSATAMGLLTTYHHYMFTSLVSADFMI